MSMPIISFHIIGKLWISKRYLCIYNQPVVIFFFMCISPSSSSLVVENGVFVCSTYVCMYTYIFVWQICCVCMHANIMYVGQFFIVCIYQYIWQILNTFSKCENFVCIVVCGNLVVPLSLYPTYHRGA